MFAERFISYTQSIEDVNSTVMGRVFKFAQDIPGLNVISIAMQSITTDRCHVCQNTLSQSIVQHSYLQCQHQHQEYDQGCRQVISSYNRPVISTYHHLIAMMILIVWQFFAHVLIVAGNRSCWYSKWRSLALLPFCRFSTTCFFLHTASHLSPSHGVCGRQQLRQKLDLQYCSLSK